MAGLRGMGGGRARGEERGAGGKGGTVAGKTSAPAGLVGWAGPDCGTLREGVREGREREGERQR